MLTVTYFSDFPKEYAIGLRQCKDLPRLREFALHWGGVCTDAWDVVSKMTDADFTYFRWGLQQESKGTFAGEKWASNFGAILMPELLMRVSLIAEHFGAPWGLAWLRCEQEGIIRRDGERYVWVVPEKARP